jgi:valyl-tRNA synthetase
MPFITEELWQSLPHKGESIVIAPYPEADTRLLDPAAEAQAELIQEIVTKVRNIRSEMNVDAKQTVPVRIATVDDEKKQLLKDSSDYIFRLAQVSQVEVVDRLGGDKLSAQAVAGGLSLEVPLAGLVDINAERARLTRELERVRREIETIERKLSNASFVDRAPKDVVEENRKRMADYQDQLAKLMDGLKRLD